jgi:hypothetical protein
MNTEPEEIQYAEPLTVDQAIIHLKGTGFAILCGLVVLENLRLFWK